MDVISTDYDRGRGTKGVESSTKVLKVESDGYQSDGEGSDLSLIADDIVNDVLGEESSVGSSQRQRHWSSPTTSRERVDLWTAKREIDRQRYTFVVKHLLILCVIFMYNLC